MFVCYLHSVERMSETAMENGVVVDDQSNDGDVSSSVAIETVQPVQENTAELHAEQAVDDGALNQQSKDSANSSTSPADCQEINAGGLSVHSTAAGQWTKSVI